jgi:polysaccharide chain length determinant protein (PEP-CTERM system associated)
MDEKSFSLNDVLQIFRRRLRLIAAVAASIFLIFVVIAAVLRDEFSVYTTILVEPQSISRKLVETGKEEQDVMNRLHLMTMQILSRSRLSKVIDELKLYPKESEEMTREQVIDMMRGRIHVEPLLPEVSPDLKKNMILQVNTFRLYFRHEDPSVGAAVANRLSNDFIDEHIKDRVQSSGDTAEFVESELERLTGRLRELEAQIAQVKGQNAGSLPEDVIANQRQVESSFAAFSLAQQRLAEAESDQAFYSQQATVARESGLGGGGRYYDKVLSPNERLQFLETQLGELRSRGFTDRHPDVIATLAEMEQVHSRIEGGEDADGKESAAPRSVAEMQARNEAQRAGLRVEGAKRESERLQKEVAAAQARLAATPRVAEQLDALEREYENLTASATDFGNKRLEAGVAANMERRQKGEQFRVLEPAYAPPDPTSPNRRLIIALGLLLGVGAGVGIALLIDVADSSYHEPRALQAALRLPVLASIPAILLDPDRARIRRRNIREAFAAVAITGFMLTSALAGYLVVNKPNLFRGEAEQTAPAPPANTTTTPPVPPAAAAAPAPAPVPAPAGGDAG